MFMEVQPVSIFLIVLSSISFAGVFQAYKQPNQRDFLSLKLVMAAITIWTFCAGIQAIGTSSGFKVFWAQLSYLGIAPSSILLLLTIEDMLFSPKRDLRTWLMWFVLPVVTVAIVWTNDHHHLFWTHAVDLGDASKVGGYGHGPLFWAQLAWQIGIIAYIVYLLIHAVRSENTRSKAYVLLIGLVPLVATYVLPVFGRPILSQFDVIPDVSPFGFAFLVPVLLFEASQTGSSALAHIGLKKAYIMTDDPILITDTHGVIVELNSSAVSKLCVSIGSKLTDIEALAEYGTIPRSELAIRNKKIILPPSRQSMIFSVSGETIASEDGIQIGMVYIFRDLSKLEGMSNELKLAEVQAIRDQVRQRLSSEIHDRISQALYSISLFTASAKSNALKGESSSLLEDLNEVYAMTQQAIRETNLLFYELEPDSFHKLGLQKALEEQAIVLKNRFDVSLKVAADNSILPVGTQREVYLVVSETLNILLGISRPDEVIIKVSVIENKTANINVAILGNKMIKYNLIKNHIDKFDKLKEKIHRLDGGLEFNQNTPNNQFIVVVLPILNSESRL